MAWGALKLANIHMPSKTWCQNDYSSDHWHIIEHNFNNLSHLLSKNAIYLLAAASKLWLRSAAFLYYYYSNIFSYTVGHLVDKKNQQLID